MTEFIKDKIATKHILPMVYVLYHKNYDDIELYGIFTEEEIKKYRHERPYAVCLLVPINYYVEKGIDL